MSFYSTSIWLLLPYKKNTPYNCKFGVFLWTICCDEFCTEKNSNAENEVRNSVDATPGMTPEDQTCRSGFRLTESEPSKKRIGSGSDQKITASSGSDPPATPDPDLTKTTRIRKPMIQTTKSCQFYSSIWLPPGHH